jgi:hypothetical protein
VSKGSNQRPASVPQHQISASWARTFGTADPTHYRELTHRDIEIRGARRWMDLEETKRLYPDRAKPAKMKRGKKR